MTERGTTVVLWGTVAAASAISVALWPVALDLTGRGDIGRLVVVAIGWAFVVGGVLAPRRRRGDRIGLAMIATGGAWWLGNMLGTRVPVLYTITWLMNLAFFPCLVFTFLAFPSGRLGWWLPRVAVASAAGAEITGYVIPVFFYDPRAAGCADCPEGLNLLLIDDKPALATFLNLRVALSLITAALLITLGLLVIRWMRSTKPARRVLAPMLVPGVVWLLAYFSYAMFQQLAQVGAYAAPTSLYLRLLDTFLVTLLILPVTYLIGLSRYPARRARVSDLVLELEELPGTEKLQDALRNTLGDPSLLVGFALDGGSSYVTSDGKPLVLPEANGNVATTFLERGGTSLGVIVHDPALLDDPDLVDAVGAATRFALENERLQAKVRAQLEEVRASRMRVIEAADDERRRVERNLHDGAQARLISLSLALQATEAKLGSDADPDVVESLGRVKEDLNEALVELRQLSRGLYPPALSEGLGPALQSLVDRAPVRVSLLGTPAARVPQQIEAAAYFVAAEAVANVAKHAGAGAATLSAAIDDGHLVIEVSDCGSGSVNLEGGSGLKGLRDRIEALDGRLLVDSRPGMGTTIIGRIPCG